MSRPFPAIDHPVGKRGGLGKMTGELSLEHTGELLYLDERLDFVSVRPYVRKSASETA